MEPGERERLSEKRRLLQLRMKRAGLARTFRSVAPLLCERGVQFAKATPEQCREALGSLTSGLGRDERLIWDGVTEAACAYWSSDAERDRLLREALAARAAPDERVVLIWHPYEAGLRIKAGDLAEHGSAALDASGETVWIVAAAGGDWLIEVAYWDREICHAPDMFAIAG